MAQISLRLLRLVSSKAHSDRFAHGCFVLSVLDYTVVLQTLFWTGSEC